MREEAVHLNKHEAAREALAQEVIPPRSLGAKLTGDHLVSCFYFTCVYGNSISQTTSAKSLAPEKTVSLRTS